jgi:hypothetical protein
LHVGLHVGDVVHESGNVFGGAVNLAARICAASAPGEVLVSDTVRSLARTSVTVQFEDRGQHTLKGIADAVRLFAVRPQQAGSTLEVPARGPGGLWARAPLRIAAVLVVLGIIGGGVAGGLFLSQAGGHGGPAASGYQRIRYHWGYLTTVQAAGGDCQSTDLHLSLPGSGETSGEITGSIAGTGELTLYASDNCHWGTGSGVFTFTDQGGNTLSGEWDTPFYVPVATVGLTVNAARPSSTTIYTSGTGIYEGATGYGPCVNTLAFNALGTPTAGAQADARSESECSALIAVGADVAHIEPVILELGTAVNRMTVFSSTLDLPKKAYFNVVYMNTRSQPQKGLSLRLRSPHGVAMRAVARDEKEAAAGERIWALPDLAPREVGRFVFSVTFLSAKDKTVPIVAEIDGDGFDPVRSDPLQIEIAQ